MGVCSYHFNHDQKNLHDPGFKKTKNTGQSILHQKRCLFCEKLFYFFKQDLGCEKHLWNIIGKNIQVVCNGQVNCSVLESYDSVCKRHNEVKNLRYVYCNCYEREGGHLHASDRLRWRLVGFSFCRIEPHRRRHHPFEIGVGHLPRFAGRKRLLMGS